MNIDKADLLAAAAKLGIGNQAAEKLWKALNEKSASQPAKFELSNLLYYFGAMIVILALAWFSGIIWEKYDAKGVLAMALIYMSAFLGIGSFLWKKKDLKVPGGLFVTMAVCMIPLAVYGFQKLTGLWIDNKSPGQYQDFFQWIKGGWFFMEAATIIGGCLALTFFRFPFLTAPIYLAFWFMSMDIVSLYFEKSGSAFDRTQLSSLVSMLFGVLVLISAYLTDLKAKEDFAFWGYLFGTIIFWTGLTLWNFESGFDDFIYLLINIGLVALSLLLQRTVLLIFGALGVLTYITTIYGKYFSDSVLFPIMLSLTGLLIIFAGIAYQKNRRKIDGFVRNLFPQSLQNWLPKPK